VKSDGNFDDVKLGPVGSRGRVVLTYICKSLYSYTKMTMNSSSGSKSDDELDDGGRIIPLAVFLPYTSIVSTIKDSMQVYLLILSILI